MAQLKCIASVLVSSMLLAVAAGQCTSDSDCSGATPTCCISSAEDPGLNNQCVFSTVARNKNCQTSGTTAPTSATATTTSGQQDVQAAGEDSSTLDLSDVCFFTASDVADCLVLGKIRGRFYKWPRCSQDCLDELNIKDEAVSPALLSSMFPNTDGTGGNVNTFVSYLRNDGSSVTNSIKFGFPVFFEDRGGIATFKDTVFANNKQLDCKSSAATCWDEFKIYLANDPTGSTGMRQVGEQLWNNNQKARELEQSLCRIRMCALSDGTESNQGAVNECSNPLTAVAEVRSLNPSWYCSAFGLGPGFDLEESGTSAAGALMPMSMAILLASVFTVLFM